MDKKDFKEIVIQNAKEIAEKKSKSAETWQFAYTIGLLAGLNYADAIEFQEYEELMKIADHYDDLFWEKAKSEYASAHKKLFAE